MGDARTRKQGTYAQRQAEADEGEGTTAERVSGYPIFFKKKQQSGADRARGDTPSVLCTRTSKGPTVRLCDEMAMLCATFAI